MCSISTCSLGAVFTSGFDGENEETGSNSQHPATVCSHRYWDSKKGDPRGFAGAFLPVEDTAEERYEYGKKERCALLHFSFHDNYIFTKSVFMKELFHLSNLQDKNLQKLKGWFLDLPFFHF